jgi:hypothetical protein
MSKIIAKQDQKNAPVSIADKALNAAKNTALVLSVNAKSNNPNTSKNELTKLYQTNDQAVRSGDIVLASSSAAALASLLEKQHKDKVKMNEAVGVHTASGDRRKIINRYNIQNARTIDITITQAGTQADAINAALSHNFGTDDEVASLVSRSSGIIPKENSIATLQIKGSNSSTRATLREFFITGVSEQDAEKFQIVQTFGKDYIFFYNRKPLIYTINGILYNTKDKSWKDDFKENYNTFLRGTKLVEGGNTALLTYDGVEREGYLLSLDYRTDANNTNAIPFSFSMFITAESKIATRRKKALDKNKGSGSISVPVEREIQ